MIADENCTFDSEKLSSLADEVKCSVFWLEYIDHNGNHKQTAKQSYLKNFQVEDLVEKPGQKTAKTDFNYKIRIQEAPTVELRDWLLNDVFITLWE